MIDTNADELRKDYTAPLYKKYPGQTDPQPAYIELSCEDRLVRVTWSGEIGNAVPAEVWHERTLRFPVPSAIKGEVIANFIESDGFQKAAERILEGYETKWDGNNHVGIFSEDAQEAQADITSLIEKELEFEGNYVSIVSPDDYWENDIAKEDYNVEISLSGSSHMRITAATANDELVVMAKELQRRLEPGYEYAGSVLAWLESLRENLEEEKDDDEI